MTADDKYQIVVLPRRQYWDWVEAARDYSTQFGLSITSYPQTAAEFHYPHQLITVVNPANGYDQHGDLREWFRTAAPDVSVEAIVAESPTILKQILAERMANGAPFLASVSAPDKSGNFSLRWPTDYPQKTQGFAENPELYRRWNLPGHEGIDIVAPFNSNVYACADGEVYLVHDGRSNHPYGIHLRIVHSRGYRTVYAHLNEALVSQGQLVKAGDLIGRADSTGNTSGGHLHLTLKMDGATAAGLTIFPDDIIDPTPFLNNLPNKKNEMALWPQERCLIGLQTRLRGEMQEADWDVVQIAKIEALKFGSPVSPGDVERALGLKSDMLILVGLSVDTRIQIVNPADFVQRVESNAVALYDAGVRFFEIHNEPNLVPEGLGKTWQTGAQFGDWFLQVTGLLRPKLPDAKFGWPGLSPGKPIQGLRYHGPSFLAEAEAAIQQADWIGCHCFWTSEEDMMSPDGGLQFQQYRDRWPEKPLMITEFSNPLSTDQHAVAIQYRNYFHMLGQQVGIGAAFAFVVSSASEPSRGAWRTEDGELGPIPAIIGQRGG